MSTESRLDLTLGYDHATGALGDYFDALANGRTSAAHCDHCGKTWFPPHITCPNDGGACSAVDLAGTGRVVSATRTRTRLPFTDTDRDVIFVLVAMTGADNAAFGRLEKFDGDDATGLAVRLAGADGPLGHPAQAAVFEPAEDGT